jgi:hypothetical protein
VLLLYIKQADARQDKPRRLGNVVQQWQARQLEKARSILGTLGFPQTYLAEAIEAQRDIESRPGRSIEEYATPTATFLGRCFRFTAELTQRPENCDPLFHVGEHLGRLIYLVDCFVDLSRDIRKDQFNALTASFGSDPEILIEAGRRVFSAGSENYLLAANKTLESFVTERCGEIVKNILTTGVPLHISKRAEKELKIIPHRRSGSLFDAHRGLLASLLCLISADAAAGHFTWGDHVHATGYTAYGYVCSADHNPCVCYDALDCVCNPFHFRVYNYGTCSYPCIQLPKAVLDIGAIGGIGAWVITSTMEERRAEEALSRREAMAREEARRAQEAQIQREARAREEALRRAKLEAEERGAAAAARCRHLQAEATPIVKDIRQLRLLVGGHLDAAQVHLKDGASGRFWWEIQEGARKLAINQRNFNRVSRLATDFRSVGRISENLPPPFDRATEQAIDGQADLDRMRSLVGHAAGTVWLTGWEDPFWGRWRPSLDNQGMPRFGLQSPFPVLKIPAVSRFPTGRPLLVETDGRGRLQAIGAVQALLARLLASVTPGKLRFTFIDPLGLGQNVAAFMPLGDYEESLITSRAWSESEHIDKRLKELTEHVENVIQKYLRHEFKTIEDYNRQAHEVAEAYRVLVVFDFPVNFTEASARRLVSLVQNGPRCGVYPIILQDTSKPLPYGFSIQDLLQSTSVVQCKDGRFVWSEQPEDTFTLDLDPPCPPALLSRIIKEVGEAIKADSAAKAKTPVVVPYAQVLGLVGYRLEQPQGWWRQGGVADGGLNTSQDGLEIPLGLAKATDGRFLAEPQLFSLNDNSPHALIAGQTGKGKSNLLHVIITTLGVTYSPNELELYLVDLKGVEFAIYAKARLPHARVIASDSGRDFGLNVLEGLERERMRRMQLFNAQTVKDLAAYRAGIAQRLPRIVLIIDEFQELFAEDDEVARRAKTLLTGLVLTGRSFGIHMILVSQSLGGRAWDLGRVVFDQMAIRIALPCREADSRLILGDDNPAAQDLSRPGEAIYNADKGLRSGNHAFQVALLENKYGELGRYLHALKEKAAIAVPGRRPLIFDGDAAAELESCVPLAQLLAVPEWPPASAPVELWLGEPMGMEEAPTSIRLVRTAGANLVVVTREEEEGVGVLTACVLELAAQHRPGAAKVFVVDLCTPKTSWEGLSDELDDALAPVPLPIQVVKKRREIAGLFNALTAEIRRRVDEEPNAESWSGYLVILGLQRARDLRPDPDQGYHVGEEEPKASPAEQFAAILREGPEIGIHTLVWCDSFLNLARTLDARALREFAYRVVGSMSQDDSIRLLDDTAASRLDRPHQMIKYDDDRSGVLEKFRPYRIPATEWLEGMAETLRGR